MVALKVGVGGEAELFGGGEHSGVFAGAVVLEGAGFSVWNGALEGAGVDVGAP